MKYKFGLGLIFIFLTTAAAAQNRFEGYNVYLDARDDQTQAVGTCATRYVPTSTQITITDLDAKTPMRVAACGGEFGLNSPVRQVNATTATVKADDGKFKWCFTGEDKLYRISFPTDNLTGKITYNWITVSDERNLGFYNIRDFGAKGDGRTDDTVAIKSALAFVASRNGGKVMFPDGDYLVGNAPEYPNFKGFTLPSGVIVEGTGSNATGGANNNFTGKTVTDMLGRTSTRIRLRGANRALFRIGECTDRVVVRDIELYAESDENTYGIEAVGAFLSSQDFFFDRVTFNKFFRGIYAHALPVTQFQWQFDFVKIHACRFVFNRDAGVWMDFFNSDWSIKSTFFLTPAKTPNARADAIYIYRIGTMLIEDTFAGAPPGNRGGDFIHAEDSGNMTVIGSQCEKMSRSIAFAEIPNAGNLGLPVTFINNVFGDPVEIKGRRTLVSVGNWYDSNTIKLHPLARVYSTGDRFCYDGYIIGCNSGTGASNFQGGQIIFSTGQPAEGSAPGRPTVFGHDVQFNSPIQLPNLTLENFPKPTNTQPIGNGSFVYCINCRRNSAPCQSGGTGAPAMHVGGRWECL